MSGLIRFTIFSLVAFGGLVVLAWIVQTIYVRTGPPDPPSAWTVGWCLILGAVHLLSQRENGWLSFSIAAAALPILVLVARNFGNGFLRSKGLHVPETLDGYDSSMHFMLLILCFAIYQSTNKPVPRRH